MRAAKYVGMFITAGGVTRRIVEHEEPEYLEAEGRRYVRLIVTKADPPSDCQIETLVFSSDPYVMTGAS